MAEDSPRRRKRRENRAMDEPRECPNCGSKEYVVSRNQELVCADCGLVLTEDVFDLGAEWREFSSEDW